MPRDPKKPNCDSLINLFPDPFVIIDRQFRIVSSNQKYKDHYKQNDIVGKHCYEVSHGSDRPCSQNGEHCPLEEVVQTGKPTSVMHIHCNCDCEEHVQLSASPIFDDEGNVQFMGESIQPVNNEPEHEQTLLGRSKAALRLMSVLYRVAPTPSPVMLLGESGVGKISAARYVHQHSTRAKQEFVLVDCKAIAEDRLEDELFGTEQQSGLFEAANHGTLFINEIAALPLYLQTRLLRVLESGTIEHSANHTPISVDVRIIVASQYDPQKMLNDKQFRSDLYYRLCAFPVNVPPLRERKGDIPLLAESFLKQTEAGEVQIPLEPEVVQKLLDYDYPGNLRELKNIIESALILSDGSGITVDSLVFKQQSTGIAEPHTRYSSSAIKTGVSQLTRADVKAALLKCNGHRAQAAQLLGVSERTIYRHLKN